VHGCIAQAIGRECGCANHPTVDGNATRPGARLCIEWEQQSGVALTLPAVRKI